MEKVLTAFDIGLKDKKIINFNKKRIMDILGL